MVNLEAQHNDINQILNILETLANAEPDKRSELIEYAHTLARRSFESFMESPGKDHSLRSLIGQLQILHTVVNADSELLNQRKSGK